MSGGLPRAGWQESGAPGRPSLRPASVDPEEALCDRRAIVLAATPLTGHIRPVLNLARHLAAAGRRVTVVSGSRFAPQDERCRNSTAAAR